MNRPTLDYSSRRPQRRRWLWIAISLVCAVSAVVTADFRHESARAWHRSLRMHRQSQVMRFLRAADAPISTGPDFAREFVDGNKRVIFMHARNLPNGSECLVVLTGDTIALGLQEVPRQELASEGECYLPGIWSEGARLLPGGTRRQVFLGFGKEVQVFNGQPDPKVPSRFSFRYEVDGKSGVYDCWLDNEAIIQFKARDGPALEPVP